jgi:transcriptional regulator with GAF, ATPase, and Fis domain
VSDSPEKSLRGALNKLHEKAAAEGTLPELAKLLDQAAARAHSGADAAAAPAAAELPGRFGMIGQSPAMEALFSLIERVSASHVPVLVHGETGSGKELVARALHTGSPRADKVFLAENCAAIAASLLESELFGHVRGAFTDASRDRDGSFVAADGGTVFLDEIGDMPMEMQAKILRVVQEGEVRPVGSNKVRKVDVRLVAASHRDLGAMVKSGEFREDLLYRLNVITLEVPALRDRPGDVDLLADFYLRKICGEDGTALATLTPAARTALNHYAWPGNVRELENEIRRATALLEGTTIDVSDLSPALNP